ncbi:hypothetical protein, partial [Heyndrickxia ginsengihumi]|uniref:hypothetical protein n=1 Tax=Heyndrickxia ginsengihumi TaxID=363870 RepID=UPI003D20B0A4
VIFLWGHYYVAVTFLVPLLHSWYPLSHSRYPTSREPRKNRQPQHYVWDHYSTVNQAVVSISNQ